MHSWPSSRHYSRVLVGLAVLGAAQLFIYGVLAFQSPADRSGTEVVLLALCAAGLYLTALILARHLSGRRALLLAIAFGLAFRIALLPEAPDLSDDYFRYLWDGILQHRGINPYRYAPTDPALAGVADTVRARVNHPAVPTIYPPLAQAAFALAALFPGGWIPLKLIWLACDAGIGAILYRLVPADRRLGSWLVYWWSPLVVIEVAWNAHLDLLGALPLMLAIWLARLRTPRAAPLGIALAAATLVKYFALALVPSAVRVTRRRTLLIGFVLTVVALYLPYLAVGPRLFEGLATFAGSWRFNDGLFRLLTWITFSPGAAKLVAGVLVLLIVIQSVRNEWTLERSAFWVVGAILMLSPTVHPWYLLWMVPLLALRPSRGWLYLCASIFLAYYGLDAYRASGAWPEPWWVKLAIYGPFVGLLMADAWRGSWASTAWEVVRHG